MNSSLGLLATMLLLTALSFGQDHAPTVEQCRADQRLWSAEFNKGAKPNREVTFDQLTTRIQEMGDCAEVDPDHILIYSDTGLRLVSRQSMRLLHFVSRHNLYDQFIAEDAAGKR